MNITENMLLQQMKQMAANMTLPQSGGKKDKAGSSSFQDLMGQTQNTQGSKNTKETADKPKQEQKDQSVQDEAPVQKGEKEELRPEDVVANPNAAILLFRPEVEELPAEEVVAVAAPIEAIPEEAVEETAMATDGQLPTLDTTVETAVQTDTAPKGEEQPQDEITFQQAVDKAPVQTAEAKPVEAEVKPEEAPERVEAEAVEVRHSEAPQDVEGEVQEKAPEEIPDEAVAQEPVFHEVETAPVKVGETYEPVDTQEPDMEAKLAATNRTAVQSGAEKVEIRLMPENLGRLTIEMTRDSSGALQVVLHASNSRAAGVLNEHLDGLRTALQNYGQQEVRVEVQRGEESQRQQAFQNADPDGRGQRHQQQQRQEEQHQEHSEDFLQKLRLGLFGTEEGI